MHSSMFCVHLHIYLQEAFYLSILYQKAFHCFYYQDILNSTKKNKQRYPRYQLLFWQGSTFWTSSINKLLDFLQVVILHLE